jgi:hypothetical protein
MINSISFGKTV